MSKESTGQVEQEYRPTIRTKLRVLGDNLDLDNRFSIAKRVTSFEVQLFADLGDTPSEAQRCLARRAGVLDAVLSASDAQYIKDGNIDLQAYVLGSNALRRILASLCPSGLGRASRRVGIVEAMDG